MPYIERRLELLTEGVTKQVNESLRTVFEPLIVELACAVSSAKSYEDLARVHEAAATLGASIVLEVKKRGGSWDDFIGLLNYCCTTTYLRLLPTRPKIRYKVMARIEGLFLGLANTFERMANDRQHEINGLMCPPTTEALESWCKENINFEDWSKSWAQILRYAFIVLAYSSAPNFDRDEKELIAGMFMHINKEFYRRIGAVYELIAISNNGDLPEFLEYSDIFVSEFEKIRASSQPSGWGSEK